MKSVGVEIASILKNILLKTGNNPMSMWLSAEELSQMVAAREAKYSYLREHTISIHLQKLVNDPDVGKKASLAIKLNATDKAVLVALAEGLRNIQQRNRRVIEILAKIHAFRHSSIDTHRSIKKLVQLAEEYPEIKEVLIRVDIIKK